MLIEKVDLFHVKMPMKEPWRTAFSEETHIDSVIVRMEAAGQVGWGETAPYRSPQYSPEWADGAFSLMRDWLVPAILGTEIDSGQALAERLTPFKGNYFAKAGLDLAWWDAHAKSMSLPLWKAIGGQDNRIDVGADIAVMEEMDDLLAAIGQSLEAGFRRVKLKFRRGWGVEMVATVRATFPEAVFHVDCNSGFTLDDLDMFKALDQYGLAMIEQPLAFDDLVDHATLQAAIETPICLDESVVSVNRVRKAIDMKACGWINLKTGRPGGLTQAIAIHDLCQSRGIPCWVGGMLESAVGQGHSIALSTLGNIKYPCDIFPTQRLYAEDLAEPEVCLDGPAMILAPDRPGQGFAPHPDRLKAMTVQHAELGV